MANRSLKSLLDQLIKERIKLQRYSNKFDKTHRESKLYEDRRFRNIYQEEECFFLIEKINKRLPKDSKLPTLPYVLTTKIIESKYEYCK